MSSINPFPALFASVSELYWGYEVRILLPALSREKAYAPFIGKTLTVIRLFLIISTNLKFP